jgi:hypothetical protein
MLFLKPDTLLFASGVLSLRSLELPPTTPPNRTLGSKATQNLFWASS